MLGLSIPEVAERGPGLDATAAALIARMSVAPSGVRARAIDAAVRALKASGVWPRLAALHLIAAHDAQAARLNWVQPVYDLTAVNAPVFTVDRGYAGDGAAAYLDTGWAPNLGAQDSLCFGVWDRTGTQSAAGIVLIAADSIRSIDLPDAAIGTDIRLMAEGPGDTDGPVEAEAAITGLSMAPPSPVHFAATRDEDGGATIRWVRRSRNGWRWIDGADAPLGEESERYRVTIAPEGGTMRTLETDAPMANLTADEAGAGATVSVRQAGSHGLSRSAAIYLPALD